MCKLQLVTQDIKSKQLKKVQTLRVRYKSQDFYLSKHYYYDTTSTNYYIY